MNDELDITSQVSAILAQVRKLASDYYRLTGKPLGVTGELAEYAAADLLGWELAPPRESGFDAIRRVDGRMERIQIKGRVIGPGTSRSQRLGRIKQGAACDIVVLVFLNSHSMDVVEIWEAPYSDVAVELSQPGSKARERGSLSVAAFKRIARQTWVSSKNASDHSFVDPENIKICPACGQ